MKFKVTRVSDDEILIEGEDDFAITLLNNPFGIKVRDVIVPLEQLLKEDRDGRSL